MSASFDQCVRLGTQLIHRQSCYHRRTNRLLVQVKRQQAGVAGADQDHVIIMINK